MPASHASSFTTSDGCTIAYTRRTGERGAPRLALIHSLALNASIWDEVVAQMEGRVELLTWDCRGHGASSRVASAYSAGLFARDLAELFDHVGWDAAVVAGCSMGGNVAQAFALAYPARTSALGLIDTTAWYGAPEKWRERAETAKTKGLAALIDFQLTRWVSDRFRLAHQQRMQGLVDDFLANDLDCYAATCAMLGEVDARPGLASLRMPVAVVVGEDDAATPVAAAQYLHGAIAGSTLTVLSGARHLTPVECPELIVGQAVGLLRRSRTGV